MSRFIIKLKDGSKSWYLEWSSVSDAPRTMGLTLAELKRYIRKEYGQQGMEDLSERLARVEKTGTSELFGRLEATLEMNRAGRNGEHLTYDELVAWYCRKWREVERS